MDIGKESLKKHSEWKGKIKVVPAAEINSAHDLSLAYTPGVASACLEIEKDVGMSYKLTRRWNTIAVVTDGTAVLGLGDIGPEAGMPVMEGKALLFSTFAGIDAIPLCIRSKDPDEIVKTVSLLAGSFGGINLEDISAPRCFEIERKLKAACDIPVFHDDQHGTAIVVLAAVRNAMKLVGKKLENIKAVINGAGAAGTAIGKLLMKSGVKNLVFVDRCGAISKSNPGLTEEHAILAEMSNPYNENGGLEEVARGADLLIGVSKPGLFTEKIINGMAPRAVVFAMSNPVPEIMPEEALKLGVEIIGTGRSDYPNQINNLLAFPGVFRGTLDARASDINEEMKLAAAEALSEFVGDKLDKEHILPNPLEKGVAEAVAKAVKQAAIRTGTARI